MKVGTVTQKFIVSQMRLDGKFHLSDGLKVRALINKSPYGLKRIKDVCSDIYCPGIFRRHYVKSGTPFLGGGDIQMHNLDSGKYLRPSTTPNHEILQVKKGWTLVTCGGTIGETVYASNLHAKCWISQHVMRVIPKDIKEGILFAFLASKFGKLLLCTDTYGSVIPTINSESIGNLPIPQFTETFQTQVDNLVKESAKLREESIAALDKAHRLLYEILDFQPNNVASKSISFKAIHTSHLNRFEAQYHLAEGQQYDEYIKQHFQWKTLGEASKSIWRPDIFKRIYVKEGITFLGGTDIFLSVPNSEKQLSRKAPNLNDFIVDEGWILLPRSGTIGDVVYTTSQHAQKLVSEDVIRIIPNDILSGGYIFAFLSSKIGKSLIQRPIFGSVIQHIEPPHLSIIPIPILDEGVMAEIASLAETYRLNWGKAAKLEIQAISMVEQEIEKWNN